MTPSGKDSRAFALALSELGGYLHPTNDGRARLRYSFARLNSWKQRTFSFVDLGELDSELYPIIGVHDGTAQNRLRKTLETAQNGIQK